MTVPADMLRVMRQVADQTMTATCELRRMPTDRTAVDLTPATAPLIATCRAAVLDRASVSYTDDEGRPVTRIAERVAIPYEIRNTLDAVVAVERRDYVLIDGRVLRVLGFVRPTATQRVQTLLIVDEVQ